ncbi:MAG: aspartate aminotransferase family protein [Acidiferrobacteraceae bacterium]|jgi:4-aminobutyrate--pyruvate transaminase|nr:aspartate aminotransferase family protein [Acidiferrobacteraceae bacterium]MDP6434245.1 aminotransferase [Arenicellales bacterium]MDP6671826.1 aminotransferase [Arenicellales bacterium]MDP6723961.1 aminotransferase [Arenicellales bacterium]|tara:strand:- start:26583 stop:27959 length:1377 start_codon:yes stop_codon:yes gene_type:complete
MKVNSPHARDVMYHLHPFTNLAQHQESGPDIFRRGEGIYVFDDDGKRYIEGLAGLWCASLGFSEQRLVDAATRQLELLPVYHNFAHKAVEPAINLAEFLVEQAPTPMSKVFFTNSGSEANDTQVKLVWYYNNILGRPQKKKIIARHGAYHGITLAAASLTGMQYAHNAFDVPIKNIIHTDCPHYYHYGEAGENEEEYSSRLATNLENLILEEGPDTIAAFIVEPFLGAGGVIPPPTGYYEKIQPLLERYDILLIVDEVISGFYRTGNMFATEIYGLKPDLITMAKALSAAYQPLGAVMINEKIHQVLIEGSRKFGIFGTGFTYSGHPVPCAVALEAQKIYQERRIGEHVKSVMSCFQHRLHAFADHPLVGETRGLGLIGAVELVEDKATRTNFDPARKVGPWVMNRAQEHGLIIRALINDTLAFCPPLIIDEQQINEMFDCFAKALDDAMHHFAGNGD